MVNQYRGNKFAENTNILVIFDHFYKFFQVNISIASVFSES